MTNVERDASPSSQRRVARQLNRSRRAEPRAQQGEASTSGQFGRNVRRSDHPACAAAEASRHFLNGAATPPLRGAEYGAPPPVVGVFAALLLLSISVLTVHAQQAPFPGIEYPRGQDVSPTFDGWERNPDGTFSLWFGYFNRNTEEEVDVPIGPENTFDLGAGGAG